MNNKSGLDTAKDIKAINNDTVHKICSGQVVLSLAVAVKELVENSLDAGASNIDIRLKNYGVDLIEVSDNGSGINEDNFTALTMKYHTSKLNDYSDLLGVSSFGFRGEALSSLCELANLTVTTRHSSADYATKIEYDNKGNIVKKTLCSRQTGTTVNLTNLFHSLPVRQKEFHKNVKREFNKMTQLLYAYCLISVGVKITCSNHTSSNAKSMVVATQGSSSYKDNIACIFGVKQLQTIFEINPEYVSNIKENIFNGLSQEIGNTDGGVEIEDIEIDLSEDSNENETDAKSNAVNKSQGYKNVVKPVEFTGFISSCEHGSGRSSTDRQFFYVNSRPCEPTKVMKLINEIYRQHNPNQYPFVFLNINTDRTSVDVNVTPDKRKVFLIKEKIILEVLKNSLLKLFENVPRTLKVDTSHNAYYKTNDLKPDVDHPRIFNSFLQQFGSKSKSVIESKNMDTIENKIDLKRKATSMLDFISSKTIKTESSKYDHLVEQLSMPLELHNEASLFVTNIEQFQDNENKKKPTLKNLPDSSEYLGEQDVSKSNNNFSDKITEKLQDTENKQKTILKKSPDSSEYLDEQDVSKSNNNFSDNMTEKFQDNENKQKPILKYSPDSSEYLDEQHQSTSNNTFSDNFTEKKNESILYLEYSDKLPNTQIRNLSDVILEDSHKIYCKPKAQNVKENIVNQTKTLQKKDILTDKEDLGRGDRRSIILKTSLEHVTVLTNLYIKKKSKLIPTKVRFKGEINPVFNKKCEEELTKEISKESFKQMKIVGQFNLGFIITKLDDDLFIIDQHATDEIYNFEILQKTTELTSQKLVIPQSLELAGVNEQILMDNIDIFKKNGFTFAIDENAPPTKRVKLLTLPMSKNWIFSKDDIEELLFMLRESPSELCRPSRVRAMFASRACRKSVMIGTALKKSDMRVLVDHMSEIDKPWNCPHGRPTIRHLVNLAMIQTKNNCD